MFDTLPVSVTAFFSVDEVIGTLRFAGENYPHLALTLIHSGIYRDDSGAASFSCVHDFRGDAASPKLAVQDKDVVILLARKLNSIIAAQVYEVDLSMPFTTGSMLIPRAGYNILCQQEFLTEAELAGRQCQQLTVHGPTPVV
jgi:hypothetical protein